jgi:hypothetical protein
VHAAAYKVVERGGLVWASMGRRDQAPPMPDIESLAQPEQERVVCVHQRECNWLPAFEGGIQGLVAQDQVVTESMGELVDRSREHLAPSDRMIVMTRRRLNAAHELRDHGTVPPGVDQVFRDARAGAFLSPESQDWHVAYLENLEGSSARPGRAQRSRPCDAGQFSLSVRPAFLPVRRGPPIGPITRCVSWCLMHRAGRSISSPGWSARNSPLSSARASWPRTSRVRTVRSALSR